MKILKVEFKNINSLKTEDYIKIDFTDDNFNTTGLFAITGPTGAGKTTILDAITIALYRQVPRFNASHIKSGLEDVVSRGADIAESRVTFSNEGKEYEAFWSMRLTKTNGERLDKPKEVVQLIELKNGKVIANKATEFSKKIEKITHLNYDRFLRSMMLAQGEFAAFLKADKKHKVELLDQIIGNDIYKQIGRAISERVNAEKEKLKEIDNKLKNHNLLTDEEIKNKEKERAEHTEQITKLKSSQKLFNEIINWYKQFDELQKQELILKQEQEEFEKQKENSRKVVEALNLHHKAEPFEKLITELKNYENTLINRKKGVESLKPIIENLLQKKNKTIIEKSTLEKRMLLAKQQQQEWTPKLDIINKLDTEIKHIKDNIQDNNNEIKELNKVIETEDTAYKNKIRELNKSESLLQSINVFLKEKQIIEDVEKRFQDWTITLNNRKNCFATILDLKKEKDQLIVNFDELKSEVEKSSKQLTLSQQNLKSVQDEYDALNLELAKYNIQKLTSKQQKLLLNKESLSKAIALSDSIMQKKQKVDNIRHTTDNYIKEAEQIKIEIEQLDKLHTTLDELLKEVEYNLELERKVKSLEEERKKLKQGSACPLCGSTQHPFVTQYHNYDFSEKEKQYNENKQKVSAVETKKSELDRQLTKALTTIENNKQNLNNLNSEIEELIEEYKKLSLPFNYTDTLDIKSKLSENKKDIENIEKEIINTDKLQRELNKKGSDLQKVKDNFTLLKEKISVSREKQDNLSESIKSKIKKIELLTTELKDYEQSLISEFEPLKIPMPDYDATDNFIASIKLKIEEYNKKKKEKTDIENNINILKTEINNIQDNISEKKKIITDKQIITDNLNKKLEEQTIERNTLLPNTISVEQKRNDLLKTTNKAEEDYNKIHNELNEIEKSVSSKTTERISFEKEISKLTEQINTLEKELSEKLVNSYFTDRISIENALLDLETRQKYQDIKKLIDTKQTQLETKNQELNKIKNRLREQKRFETTKEEAKNRLSEIDTYIDNHQQLIGEINNTFRSNSEMLKQYEQDIKRRKEQEKTLMVWDKLFALTGGTKDSFNIYVQRLTLKSLINHANLHLRSLNERYSLQISDLDNSKKKDSRELNIEMIDHFQTDTVRGVETCSGGESFILSLSLALGLSDMASRNVKIESLFIDEGFGTLDDNLLETVISTLESLHSKGKIIGIISHVEKLKERITTQIQVTKQGNGISKVCVI